MQVQINQALYTIDFVNKGTHQLQGCLGICNTHTKQIFISDNLPNMKATLRHEVTHAVISEYMLDNVEWNEEAVASFVEKYLTIIEDIVIRVFSEVSHD